MAKKELESGSYTSGLHTGSRGDPDFTEMLQGHPGEGQWCPTGNFHRQNSSTFFCTYVEAPCQVLFEEMVCCLRKNLKAKAPLLQGETRVASEDVKPQDIYCPKTVHLISSTEYLLPKDLFVFSLLLLSTLRPHWLSAGDLASYVSKNIEAIRFKLSHLLTIISSSCLLAFAPSSNPSYSEEEALPPRTPTPTLQASLSAWTLGPPRNPTLCHIPSVSCISSLSFLDSLH